MWEMRSSFKKKSLIHMFLCSASILTMLLCTLVLWFALWFVLFRTFHIKRVRNNYPRSRKIKTFCQREKRLHYSWLLLPYIHSIPFFNLHPFSLRAADDLIAVRCHVCSIRWRTWNVIGNHVAERQHVVTFEPHSVRARFAPVLFVRLLMSACHLAIV